MKKADFLKAARAAGADILSQIAWLESQDCGDDDRAWFQALDVLQAESSALQDKIDVLKEKAEAMEAAGGRLSEAFWAAEGNALATLREAGESYDLLENQLWFYTMATNADTIREWLTENYPE